MEEKLFKIALDFINTYGIKCYNIDINPGAKFSHKIRLQGDIEGNEQVMKALPFQYDEVNGWHEFRNTDRLIIVLTK